MENHTLHTALKAILAQSILAHQTALGLANISDNTGPNIPYQVALSRANGIDDALSIVAELIDANNQTFEAFKKQKA